MAGWTDLAENKIADAVFRAQTLGAPSPMYFGLILATKGLSSGVRSTALSLGDSVVPATPNGRLYKVTTAGTTGASEPTWPTTNGGTVTDGSVTWTEQTPTLDTGTGFTEVSTSGTAYARYSVTPSLANFAGTQSAGSTTASTGTSATTSNNSAITYTQATAHYGGATPPALVYAWGMFDASTAGNMWAWGPLTTPVEVVSGATPSFAAGTLSFKVDDV